MSGIRDPSPRGTPQSSVFPPTTYTIGQHETRPLVHAWHLGGHLALLHAFDALRRDVESGDVSRFPSDVHAMDVETRWAWFVNLAVERFHRWCTSIRDVREGSTKKMLPPIDVVMVWHAYLLNPIWYAEDTSRVPVLSSLPRYTECLTRHLESPELLFTNSPHPDRVRFWRDRTKTPYDPLDSAKQSTNMTLRCPRCESWTDVPILARGGKGYAQNKFAARCRSCRGVITKELLGLYKLAKDVVMEDDDGPVAYLAGTLHSRDHRKDTRRALLIKSRVRSKVKTWSSTPHTPVLASDVMKALDYDPGKFYEKLLYSLLPRIRDRIHRAYADDRPFSIELVGAVLRQGLFVRKMAELGWTQPSFRSNDDGAIILEHCVTRYHAFLNLIANSPKSFFVPTLDIDLAWHTHQLMADRYQRDCKTLMNRYVDHDDKVEENHLATGFDATSRAWIDRYNVPYIYCGCPQPGTTLSQHLRHAFAGNKLANTALQPPETAAPGTHPSDHNAVFPMHRHRAATRARQGRREKSERRRVREAGETARSLDARRTSVDDHPEPFLYPVPLDYAPTGGCVVGVGSVVDGGAPFAGARCAAAVGGGCGFGVAGCGVSSCTGGARGSGGGVGGACGGGACGGG